MKIIRQIPNDGGAYPAIQEGNFCSVSEGYALWPDDLSMEVFYEHNGFVTLTIQDGAVQSYVPNLDAYDAWQASLPPEPDPLEATKTAKLAALATACNDAIVAGCDVTLPSGASGHISLTAEDQINLTNAYASVEAGSAEYPYHLDGQLCALYPAGDIRTMATVATAHKLYHTTYYNHVAAWVRRCETVAEVEAITYGGALPDDLAANMATVLAA